MQRKPMFTRSSPDPGETLTIRMATAADAAALGRLAQLDSAPPPGPAPMLVAELGGEVQAAVSLDGVRAIANPFRRTAGLIAMLMARVRQLQASAPGRAARRRRPIRVWRLASPRA